MTLREFYSDLRVMARAEERANVLVAEALGEPRSGYCFAQGHVLGAEVAGCGVVWPEDEEPMVAVPAVATVEGIRRYRIPDPPDNAVVRRYLEGARAFYELTGHKESVCYEGPVTTAALCLGLQAFYALAATDAGLAEELVQRVSAAMIAWKRYHDAEMGIPEQGELGLADDSASSLSPRLFARLSLPYLLEFCRAFPGYTGRSLHICGDSTHFLDQLAALHLSAFDLGEMVNPKRARAALPATYLWCIADFRLIRDCNAEEIAAYVRGRLEVGVPGERFGIHVEGWRGVPLWKARLVKDVVEAYGDAH